MVQLSGILAAGHQVDPAIVLRASTAFPDLGRGIEMQNQTRT